MTGQDGNRRPGWYTTPTPCRTPTWFTEIDATIENTKPNLHKTLIWISSVTKTKQIYDLTFLKFQKSKDLLVLPWEKSGYEVGGCSLWTHSAKTVNSISRSRATSTRESPSWATERSHTQGSCLTLKYFPRYRQGAAEPFPLHKPRNSVRMKKSNIIFIQ